MTIETMDSRTGAATPAFIGVTVTDEGTLQKIEERDVQPR